MGLLAPKCPRVCSCVSVRTLWPHAYLGTCARGSFFLFVPRSSLGEGTLVFENEKATLEIARSPLRLGQA